MSTKLVRSFLDDFAEIARQEGSTTALFDEDGRTLSYRELDCYGDRMLEFLRQQGLGKGDTVVSLMPNSLEAFLVFVACLRGGLQYSPIPCTATAAEVQAVVGMTHASLVLVAEPVSPLLDGLIAPVVGKFHRVSIGGSFDWLPKQLRAEYADCGRLIITTSGSVGAAKSIVIDGDRLWSAGMAFVRHYDLEQRQPAFWNYLPMSYLGGLFNLGLIPLAARGRALVSDTFSGKTFLSFWPTIARYELDAVWLVPAVARGLITLAQRTEKPSHKHSVRSCFLGTAPISLTEKRHFRDFFGVEVFENYGLSETTFISAETDQDIAQRVDGSVGSVLPYVRTYLVTRAQAESESEGAMEIAIESPFLMLGYLRPDGTINPALDKNGLFRTGDLGTMSKRQLVLQGRVRDIIKKGGYLVLLDEIEKVSEAHPEVREAAAVPCAHFFYGESFDLFLILRQQNQAAENFDTQFRSWLQERLVRHKWPDRIYIRSDFPRTSSGKVRKSELRVDS
jgi:acyl-coenzyme A synthetase/AMP-(fatty) acid ligase